MLVQIDKYFFHIFHVTLIFSAKYFSFTIEKLLQSRKTCASHLENGNLKILKTEI